MTVLGEPGWGRRISANHFWEMSSLSPQWSHSLIVYGCSIAGRDTDKIL